MPRVVLVMVLVGIAAGCAGPAGPDGSTSASPMTARPQVSIPPGALLLKAHDYTFSTARLDGIAGVPTVVVFTNNDPTAHSLTIYRNAAQDEVLYQGDLLSGPNAVVVYEIPALSAGEYYFRCARHQGMHGTLLIAAQPLSSGTP